MKPKLGKAGRHLLGSASLPDIRKWERGGTWEELVAKTTPAKLDGGDCSGNPPVTQLATPLIMQNFMALISFKWMSYKQNHPLTVVMKSKINYIDQNHFLYQAVNILFSAVKLGILTGVGNYELQFESLP